MILVASQSSDPTAQGVLTVLGNLRQDALLLDLGQFPVRDRLSVRYASTGKRTSSYLLGKTEIPLDTVHSILWRRPAAPKATSAITSPSIAEYVESTALEVLNSTFADLDCLQVPAMRDTLRRAQWKLPQLTLAARIGFALPETLISNDPDEALAFINESPGDVIIKSANTTLRALIDRAATGYANILNRRDLVFLQDVQICPFILQRYVKKRLEIRVTVVGTDVFAAEIHSQTSKRTEVDWRRYNHSITPYLIHALPEHVAQCCLALVDAMGLHFGAIDLILTPDDRYVFLEINPNGQYGWIEYLTGLPITQRLARLLVEHT